MAKKKAKAGDVAASIREAQDKSRGSVIKKSAAAYTKTQK